MIHLLLNLIVEETWESKNKFQNFFVNFHGMQI